MSEENNEVHPKSHSCSLENTENIQEKEDGVKNEEKGDKEEKEVTEEAAMDGVRGPRRRSEMRVEIEVRQ